MKRTRRALLRPNFKARLWMTVVMAPVFWMTENAPPQMKTMMMMAAALLVRLLHHAKVFTLDGESYRIKKSRKGRVNGCSQLWGHLKPLQLAA